jgi:hypothetical protein
MQSHPSPQNESAVLLPASISKRRLPLNFDPKDIAVFDRELEKIIPPTTLLELHDVRVSSDGFLFRRHNLLPESFAFPANMKQWKRRGLLKFFVSNYALRRRRVVENDVLWITDDWSNGYFHWLTDVLTRLYVMRDRLDQLVLLLPWNYQALDFVHGSLRAFGLRATEFIAKDEVLICRRLFMPTHTAPSGHYNETIIGAVRSLLLQRYGDTSYQGSGERVYVSRSRARKRRVVNEAEVIEVLQQFGFQAIHAEELSFEQQVKICSRAHYLVSNHGAGLTNMLFLGEGASVLELRHDSDCISNCYFTLSSALNLNYFYQTCRASDADPHFADLLVDTERLRENLRLLLGT